MRQQTRRYKLWTSIAGNDANRVGPAAPNNLSSEANDGQPGSTVAGNLAARAQLHGDREDFPQGSRDQWPGASVGYWAMLSAHGSVLDTFRVVRSRPICYCTSDSASQVGPHCVSRKIPAN